MRLYIPVRIWYNNYSEIVIIMRCAGGMKSMVIFGVIAIGLGAALLFMLILLGIKNGIEAAAYELKEDFIEDFPISKVDENNE